MFPVNPGVDLFWVNSGIVFISFLISSIYRFVTFKILRGSSSSSSDESDYCCDSSDYSSDDSSGQYSGDGGGIFGNLPQPTSRDTWKFDDPIPKIEGKRFTCWAIDTFSCKNGSCSGLGFYNIENINNIK